MKKKTTQTVNRALLTVFFICSAFLTAYNIVNFDAYYLMLSAASGALLFLPTIVYRVFRFKASDAMSAAARIFIFLAFHIGMAGKGYILIPFYDKAVHALSGAAFALLGIIVFYALRLDKKIEKTDCALCAAFSFSFSMMIAAVWEIYEYAVGFVMESDPQRVAATGVGDTMGDIIACLVGTVFLCALAVRWFKTGKSGLLLSAAEEFVEDNLR